MGLLTSTTQTATTAGHSAANAAQTPLNQLFSYAFIIIPFLFAFYLLIYRPQSKRMKEQKNLLMGLAVGDEIATNGGIIGKVQKIETNVIHLAIDQGVTITLRKDAIANVLPKGSLKSKPATPTKKKTKQNLNAS